MPLQIADVDTLQQYIQGVIGRADHHAGEVNEVALALAGAIVWRKDADPLEVMAHDGDMKNVLWFRVGGKRYAFRYNHSDGTIELRGGTTRGDVLAAFTNATPLSEVRSVFAKL